MTGPDKVLPPFRKMNFPEPDLYLEERDDGTLIYGCNLDCQPWPGSMFKYVEQHGAGRPDHEFLKERGASGDWRTLTYGEANAKARPIAQALLDREFDAERPVMVLSRNSIEHGLLMLGCFAAGVPIAPVSSGYALASTTFEKLKHVFELTTPGAVFVQEGEDYATALRALDLTGVEVIAVDPTPDDISCTRFDHLLTTKITDDVQTAIDAVGADTIGKFLFTSGSTGMPKAVVQTHGMMSSNAAQITTVRRPFPDDPDPMILDWLPWSHAFGGNSNFGATLRQGGTFHIDHGKPLPGAFDVTLQNIKDVSPTYFSTTPSAHAMLIAAMERDPALRSAFFKRLRATAYGGAALPTDLYERMQKLAIEETGERILFLSGYGATETGPTATTTWFETDKVGLLGLPVPDVTIKLVPHGDTYELRFKGPNIMPGYWRDPVKNAEAFDKEGFYKIGDAGRFLVPGDINQGLVFDGRVTEEFKLLTGTWVSVGTLRLKAVAAASPYIRDAVITGHDRDFIGLLCWVNEDQVKALTGGTDLSDPKLVAAIRDGLAAHNATNKGSSTRIKRVILMDEPPSVDGHEITDKGYINQRATLTRRAHLVDALYADNPGDDVIEIG